MKILIYCLYFLAQFCNCEHSLPLLTDLINGKFPKDFMWGVASSNYQMEGAVHQDGKGESVWDAFTEKHPELIIDGSSAAIADDSYNLWREDIQQLKLMELKYFRISISWARVLPNGKADTGVNTKALQHYRTVFQSLIDAGITPLVTIHHYDMPRVLQDLGGWSNPNIIDWYTDYARICFENYGDIIKFWFTFNSPALTTNLFLEVVLASDQLSQDEVAECLASCQYTWAHNILLAHAKVWHLYDEVYRKTQKGKVGLIANGDWYGPGSNKSADIAAAERGNQFELGWILHPVVKGDYPDVMKETIARRSKQQGYSKSKLPVFTKAQIDAVKGTFDFLGLNTYTAFQTFDYDQSVEVSDLSKLAGIGPINATINFFVSLIDPNTTYTLSYMDKETSISVPKKWPIPKGGGRAFAPWGIRKLLNWIKEKYDNPPIMITENGWPDDTGTTNDPWRIGFFEQSINNVLQAHLLDGCNVIGYFAWSFLDAWEWQGGYVEKYGLVKVDQNDPKRRRHPKLSSRYFGQLAKDNGFLAPEKPYSSYLKQRFEKMFGKPFAMRSL